MNEKTINCESFIQQTLIGFCIHIFYNFTELQKHKMDHLDVKNFYLRFHYPINATSNIKLFLIPFNETKIINENSDLLSGLKPPLTTLLPNVLTVIRINELFKIKKDKPYISLKIERNGMEFETTNYLTCIDYVYENEIAKSNCNERIFVSMLHTMDTDATNSTFAHSSCSLLAAKSAKNFCQPLEFDENFFLADVSVLSGYKLPKFISKFSSAGNVIVTFRGMQKRTTLYTRKTELWKLISDIGGTFSLYTGFTFLSILETIAFFSSSTLRKSATQDEQTLMERKNPPIKFPIQSKRMNKIGENLKEKIVNFFKYSEKLQSSVVKVE